MDFNDQRFRQFLSLEFQKRQKKNGRYSLRAFARFLKMDHSNLSKGLQGKRKFGKNVIKKMCRHLGLEEKQFTTPYESLEYQRLSLDAFQMISDWYHYGILELMKVHGFTPDYKWVAAALQISAKDARAAVDRLKRLGLISQKPNAWIDQSDGTSSTVSHLFTHKAFRNLQKQILEMAITAMEETPIEERDQTSMTMAIDSSKLPEAKARIKKFRREMDAFLSKPGYCDRVYHMSISLYPVSKRIER